jgi:L-aspartate oxidase
MIAECALEREESRGAHLRSDFPETDPRLDGHHTVIGGSGPRMTLWD